VGDDTRKILIEESKEENRKRDDVIKMELRGIGHDGGGWIELV
jgi:hypothetical protein